MAHVHGPANRVPEVVEHADQTAYLVVCADPNALFFPASPGVDEIPGVDAGSQQYIAVALTRSRWWGYTWCGDCWSGKSVDQASGLWAEGLCISPNTEVLESLEQIESKRCNHRGRH